MNRSPAHAADRHGNLQSRHRDEGPGQLVRIRKTALTAIVVIAVMIGIRVYVVETYAIPSQSMSPTLETGDRMTVLKIVPGLIGISRGDVVVFSDPAQWLPAKTPIDRGLLVDVLAAIGVVGSDPGNLLVKRVIGLAGDHVVCCSAGHIVVNGVALDEPYLAPAPADYEDFSFDITVPPNRLWVMGDNRSNSSDSRFHMDDSSGGFVPVSNVVGHALLRILPLDRFGVIPGFELH